MHQYAFLICAFPSPLQRFLQSHLSSPSLSSSESSSSAFILVFPQDFYSNSFFCFWFSTPPFSSTCSLLPQLLFVFCALGGTAHSATKQSCLQHQTLTNQAKPECSSPQVYSTTQKILETEGHVGGEGVKKFVSSAGGADETRDGRARDTETKYAGHNSPSNLAENTRKLNTFWSWKNIECLLWVRSKSRPWVEVSGLLFTS